MSDPLMQFSWLPKLSWRVPALASMLLLLYSLSYLPEAGRAVSLFATAVLMGAASLVVGALLGFLFGVPRALQTTSSATSETSGQYAVNTNLEQISDWLTKIIVGVGLVELGAISRALGNFLRNLQDSFGGRPESAFVAGAALSFFVAWGFLLGYLLTRTYLLETFRAFDLGKVASEAAIAAIDRSNALDAHALRLVSLKLHSDADTVQLDDLKNAISAASSAAQEQILAQARTQRQNTWRWSSYPPGSEVRERMARQHGRVRVLLEAFAQVRPNDPGARGELGYALKDDENPDLTLSRIELVAAIECAREIGQKVYWYQFNLAVVQIRLEEAAGEIWSYLNEAYTTGSSRLKRVIREDEEVQRWLKASNRVVGDGT